MFESLRGLHEALERVPYGDGESWDLIVAAACRVAWMVTPCDQCHGVGHYRGIDGDFPEEPCPSCVGGLRPSPEATEAVNAAMYEHAVTSAPLWVAEVAELDWQGMAEAVIKRLVLEDREP